MEQPHLQEPRPLLHRMPRPPRPLPPHLVEPPLRRKRNNAWVGFRKPWVGWVILATLLLPALAAAADTKLPLGLEGVGIKEKIGLPVDLTLQFSREDGRVVALKDVIDPSKPTIVTLVYYECPQLCTLVLNGLIQSLDKIDWTVGKEFNVVTVSINPSETPELAGSKRQGYLAAYGRDVQGKWPFLVDYQGNVKKLANQVGWNYRYDERTKQFAHAAAIMLLTPDGRVSRYLYGVRFRPADLRLGLVEAGQGKLGTVIERLILFCYHYDPNAGSYVLFAQNLMKVGGVVTMVVIGAFLFLVWRREGNRPVSPVT